MTPSALPGSQSCPLSGTAAADGQGRAGASPGTCQVTRDGDDETYWLFCDLPAGHEPRPSGVAVHHDPFWGDFEE